MQRPFFELRVRYGSVSLKDFKPKQTRRGVKAGAWGKRKLYEGVFITDKIRAICLRVKARRGSQSRSYGDHPSATGPSNPQPGAKRRKSLSCAFFLSSVRTSVSSRARGSRCVGFAGFVGFRQRPSRKCQRLQGGFSRYCADALFAGHVARSFSLVFDFQKHQCIAVRVVSRRSGTPGWGLSGGTSARPLVLPV